MPVSFEHESPIDLCREQPDVVPVLLRDVFHVELPLFSSVRAEDPNFTQVAPDEFRADTAIILEAGRPCLAVVSEVQRGIDRRKRFTWPLYTAALHARFECTTYLLVIALTRPAAAWAREAIATFQPGSLFAPLVAGPDEVPRIETLAEARRQPRLAALSALLHGNEVGGEQVAAVAVEAVKETDGAERAVWLYNLVRAILDDDKLKRFEDLIMMTTEHWFPRTDFEKEHYGRGKADGQVEGQAEGKAEAVLAFLSARGLEVSEDIRQRVRSCKDLAVLDRWIARAATASTAADVLADS